MKIKELYELVTNYLGPGLAYKHSIDVIFINSKSPVWGQMSINRYLFS